MPIILKVFVSVLCILNIFNPLVNWKLTEGLKNKNAEPTDIYLLITRISGVVVLIFVWFFM